jgi:hypothetical protein
MHRRDEKEACAPRTREDVQVSLGVDGKVGK